MSSWKPFLAATHAASLAVWLGAVLASGLAAGVTFPALKSLNPALPEYAGYSGPHWLIAGGHVAQKAFLISDILQFGAAFIAAVSLGGLILAFRPVRSRRTLVVHVAAVVLAVGTLTANLVVLAPSMNGALKEYWSAAKSGNTAAALTHQQAFDDLHPLATKLLGGEAILILIAIIAAAWGLARHAAAPRSGELEVPLLARGR